MRQKGHAVNGSRARRISEVRAENERLRKLVDDMTALGVPDPDDLRLVCDALAYIADRFSIHAVKTKGGDTVEIAPPIARLRAALEVEDE